MKVRIAIAVVSLALSVSAALAVPFWGAKQSMPAGTAPGALEPGQFVWEGSAVPAGPIVVVVSLEEQRAYVYRNGIQIGVSTVSSGKNGFQTPTGVFTVLQKDKDHRSSIYNSAPMPYTERLTWGGVSLHAGGLPGYPSSHGCVHLPSEFARLLFDISAKGMVVVIANSHAGPSDVIHPPMLSPIDAASGAALDTPRLADGEEQRWNPAASPQGPVSILVSGADRRVIVFRNGVEIGRAKVQLRGAGGPLGTQAYSLLDPASPRPQDTDEDDGMAPRWLALALPGKTAGAGVKLTMDQADRVVMPSDFAEKLRGLLAPGTTMVVTDEPVLEQTTGVPMTVVTADPPVAPGAAKGTKG